MEINFKGVQPQYMSQGAAGADLEANESINIIPNGQYMIDTGTAVEIPEGYYGMVCPRSSLCNKMGLHMVNSVGIIDSDYRGTIKLVYKNTSENLICIDKGERIGQIILMPFIKANFLKVDTLDDTIRGEGGFGHTGK